ncbi:NAD(P)-dependent oxidoreductase [Candidatus Saccharibacteria bacterium]|nr:NAD(P)-dependent oxidoreductase [Candidatus Saccharibacteria bacterium]
MNESEILIIGANGQLGSELQKKYPNAVAVDSDQLDITNQQALNNFDWSGIKIIINAAAYTNVDGAETPQGRITAWQVNANAPANLVNIAKKHSITIVHISSDYVFDGTNNNHNEQEPFSPLSVYGSSKAAGDIAVALNNSHYILRTSWVIGQGKNFVNTMLSLAQKGVNPTVVADQIGRLTFTSELTRAIHHLLTTNAPFGTYNVSNSGNSASWADITRQIFQIAGVKNTVTNTTTAEYFANKQDIAPRPLQSTLNLDKIQNIGFKSTDWQDDLKTYIVNN